jgi:hypothetical protein
VWNYHAQETCLGNTFTLLPDPVEPPRTAIYGVPYEAFGAASDPQSPDFGYITGTSTYHDPVNGDQVNPIDTRTDQSVFLPIEPPKPGLAVPVYGGTAVGAVTFSGGHAHSQIALTLAGDPPPSPSTFNFDLPWRQATDCPIPQLPPPPG